jgi:hypothetical protein
MTNKYIEEANVHVNWSGKTTLFVSYKKIMTNLGIYTTAKAGLVLTDTQKKINEIIENTKSFNVNVFARVYYSQYGRIVYKDITNDKIDDFLSINGYTYKEIKDLSSIALYGISEISITLNYTDYANALLEESNDAKITPSFPGCTVYFTIEGPDYTGETVLHTVRMECLPNDEETDSSTGDDAQKEDTGETDFDDIDDTIDVTPGFDDDDDDSTDDAEVEKVVTASTTNNTSRKYIYFNSISLEDLYKNNPDGSFKLKSKFLHVYCSPLCPVSFTLYVVLTGTTASGKKKTTKKTYTYEPKGINITNVMAEHVYKMNNPDVSYALLRANPKLTGNIKVVVDSNENIYLDTFKVSDVLSQRKYRHISVGADTYYGKSLMSKFKDMPLTDFYKIPDKCYTLYTTAQTYENEYFDVYNSSVSTNSDELYSENFALLAPLCVKRIMPDFFLVFKVDKNSDDYDEINMSNKEKIEYFIKNGKLVKSYDLRINSNLGKYIRNIYDNSKSYVGDLFASYDTNNYNKFIGISIDKGVVAPTYESAYKQETVKSQVALNDFFTLGFERNHLVSKDIINFEFLFNDVEDETFSINTYFGLYVKLNTQTDDFSCIGIDSENIDSSVLKYAYDTSIYTFGTSKKLTSIPQYAHLIYGVSTPSEFIRLNTSLEYDDINSQFLLKPYKNILTTEIFKTAISNYKSYITIKYNDIMDVGDHIRVIIPGIKTIYEILMSDKDSLDTLSGVYVDEHYLTEVITNYYNVNSAGWTIKRIGMFIPYKRKVLNGEILYNDETETIKNAYNAIDKEIETQVQQLFFAFKKFNESTNVTSWKYNNTSLSIVSLYENTIFERICSTSGFIQSQYDYIMTTTDEDNTLEFFGSIYPDKTIIDLNNTDWQKYDNFYLYPLHFEFIGTRMGYIINFLKVKDISKDFIYSASFDDIDIFKNKSIVYLQNDSSSVVSTIYNDIPITTYKNINDIDAIDSSISYVRYVTAYDNLSNKVLNLRNPKISNSQVSLYSTYKINSGICSVLQVKDFDYDVLDNDDALLDYELDSVIGEKGEYSEKSIFNLTSFENINDSSVTVLEDDANYIYVDSGNEGSLLTQLNDETSADLVAYNNKQQEYDKKELELNEKKQKLSELDTESTEYENLSNDIQELSNELEKLNTELAESQGAYDKMISTVYICIPIKSSSNIESSSNINKTYICDIYDVTSTYYKRKIEYKLVSTSDVNEEDAKEIYAWQWGEQCKTSTQSFTAISSGYDKNPIRTTSEESIKDYIDKYKIIDTSIRNNPWYGDNEENDRCKFLNDIFNKNHKYLDISLISPYCCKWKSVGTDARGEKMRLMYYDSSIETKSYYIVGSETTDCSTYIGYLYASTNDTDTTIQNSKKYISRSLDQVIKDTSNSKMTKMYTFKDFILNGNGSIDDILYSANMCSNRFSIAYLSGDNTLEFISAGVKIRIHSNNDNIINFNNYVGYSAIFIVLPASNLSYKKNTELIIDELTHELLYVWYCPTTSLKMNYMIDSTNAIQSYTYPLNIDFSLSDLELKYIRETSNSNSKSYASILLKDSLGLGNLSKYYDGFRIADSSGKTDEEMTLKHRNSHRGLPLSTECAYLYISGININVDAYTKIKSGGINVELNPTTPLFANAYEKFPYYYNNMLLGINPIISYNVTEETATNSQIEVLSNNISEQFNTYIMSNTFIPQLFETASYNTLSNVSNNISIFIKTSDGVKDFTKVDNLLNVELVDPIEYYKNKVTEHNINSGLNKEFLGRVHSTYAEPVMKDMFEFDYSSASRNNRLIDEYESLQEAQKIDTLFNTSFDGANVSIKNINSINQLWINKYTEMNNYCYSTSGESKTYRLGLDVIKNYSVINDPWFFNTYRKYTLVDYNKNKNVVKKEFYSDVKGYKTGYELRSFFNSKAIVLNGSNGNTITITSWKNTKIYKNEKYIKLNITDSLIYNILFANAFNVSWKALSSSTNNDKINYIKNTILKFININNKTKFSLYKDLTKRSVLSFNSEYITDSENIVNFKNELKYENGKYYMYVYPEDMSTYYAKMIITL